MCHSWFPGFPLLPFENFPAHLFSHPGVQQSPSEGLSNSIDLWWDPSFCTSKKFQGTARGEFCSVRIYWMGFGEDGGSFSVNVVVSQKTDFAAVWSQWVDRNPSAEGTGKKELNSQTGCVDVDSSGRHGQPGGHHQGLSKIPAWSGQWSRASSNGLQTLACSDFDFRRVQHFYRVVQVPLLSQKCPPPKQNNQKGVKMSSSSQGQPSCHYCWSWSCCVNSFYQTLLRPGVGPREPAILEISSGRNKPDLLSPAKVLLCNTLWGRRCFQHDVQ